MTDRIATEQLLHNLYAARLRGDLDGVCSTFTPDAVFRIAGASFASPMAMTADGVEQIRPLLAMLIKTFPQSNQRILSIVIDGAKAAVHWRVKIFSRVTGTTVPTELIDVLETRDGLIASFTELFSPTNTEM
jgi:ketosteroid isomerase-like protein